MSILGRREDQGAYYEETCVDRRTALSDVASRGAVSTTAAGCRRPDKQFVTHRYRRYLPSGNGGDVLQCTHKPEP